MHTCSIPRACGSEAVFILSPHLQLFPKKSVSRVVSRWRWNQLHCLSVPLSQDLPAGGVCIFLGGSLPLGAASPTHRLHLEAITLFPAPACHRRERLPARPLLRNFIRTCLTHKETLSFSACILFPKSCKDEVGVCGGGRGGEGRRTGP